MDIMEKVNDIVDAITKNDDLMAQFKKDPAGAIQKVLDNIDLDDELMEKLVAAVRGKLDLDRAANLLGGLKKLF